MANRFQNYSEYATNPNILGDPYEGYTVGGGTNPLTGIAALTYSSPPVTAYKMQPGFTAET